MDKLDRSGFDWRYDSNYSLKGKVDSGKSYVDAIVGDSKIRIEWDD